MTLRPLCARLCENLQINPLSPVNVFPSYRQGNRGAGDGCMADLRSHTNISLYAWSLVFTYSESPGKVWLCLKPPNHSLQLLSPALSLFLPTRWQYPEVCLIQAMEDIILPKVAAYDFIITTSRTGLNLSIFLPEHQGGRQSIKNRGPSGTQFCVKTWSLIVSGRPRV